ncbi:MAG TPA: FAD-dependent oxidoreductase [Candidatus Binatia bacterium]|nr:FAD-dependent oxidoreductase [Candidatus Binatia bacterium]
MAATPSPPPSPASYPFRLRIAERLPATADLVVVGGGVVGCATALAATGAGLRTVVIDARPRPATLTTPAATGAFRLQFDNAEELALVREGIDFMDDVAARTGLPGYDIGLVRRGYLFCAFEEASTIRQRSIVELQRTFGLDDVEILSGDETRARFPYVSPDVRQSRFRQGDGTLDQVRLAWAYALGASNGQGVQRPAGTAAASFALGIQVTGFRMAPDGHRLEAVETTGGEISAPLVVLATGPFLAATAALAGVSLDIRPTRRQKVVLPEVPEVPPDAPMTIDEENATHWRPALRGAFLLCTEPGTATSEPVWEVPGSPEFAFRLLDPASPLSAARLSPFWADSWERGDRWYLQAGQYEYTPDRRPYIGRVGPEGLAVNGGYSGHGVMSSAGGSRLLLDLLLDRDTAPPGGLRAADDPFRVDRPMPEREFDLL